MNQKISNRDWVEYSLGDLKLIGLVEDGGEGIYWFNSLERLIEGRMSLTAHVTDIRVLPLEMCEEDIESMIDLALQTKDKEWFDELVASLKIMRLSFSEFLNRIDIKAVGSDWDNRGKARFEEA